MRITEVKVRKRDGGDGKLKAYVSITIDDAFVIRDLKIIEGKNGLFVAMPSVKLSVFCPKCNKKSPIGSKFCCQCGASVEGASTDAPKGAPKGAPSGAPLDGLPEQHRDLAHPITSEARDYLQKMVLGEYHKSGVKSGVKS